MFETQKSGSKTSSGEIGLDIRTNASPKVGQDQVSGGVTRSTSITPYRGEEEEDKYQRVIHCNSQNIFTGGGGG